MPGKESKTMDLRVRLIQDYGEGHSISALATAVGYGRLTDCGNAGPWDAWKSKTDFYPSHRKSLRDSHIPTGTIHPLMITKRLKTISSDRSVNYVPGRTTRNWEAGREERKF